MVCRSKGQKGEWLGFGKHEGGWLQCYYFFLMAFSGEAFSHVSLAPPMVLQTQIQANCMAV